MNNIRYFVKTMTDITHCNGYAIAAKTETCITWGKMKYSNKNQKKSCFGISKNYKMKKNYMQIPRGKVGKTLIAEVTRLIRLFNSSRRWEPVAIHMLQVFLPLLLQKPSLKSKNREHVKYLNKRIEWWKYAKLEELISECEAIQKRLKRSVKTKKQSDQKAFCRLMLQGQVKKALRFVDHASDIDEKHESLQTSKRSSKKSTQKRLPLLISLKPKQRGSFLKT